MAEKVSLKLIQSSRLTEIMRTEICMISIWEIFNGCQLIYFRQMQLQKYDLLSSEQFYNYFHNKQHNYEPFAMLIYFRWVL